MPTIYDAIGAFQRRLLRQEARAASQMVRAYHAGWKRLKALLDALEQEYEAYAAQGLDVPGAWYYYSSRARALHRQIATELEKYSAWSEKLVSQQQRTAITQTLARSEELIQLGLDPRAAELDITFNRISTRAVEAMVGINQPNSPLSRLFLNLSREGTARAQNTLIQGVLLGYSPRKIAPMLRDALGVSLSRALNIARTETIRASRVAALESYRANDRVVKGWIWNAAIGDSKTCPACVAMHGTVHPLDEEMQSHPGCRCAASPGTYTWEELFERWGVEGGAAMERGDGLPDADKRWYDAEARFREMTDEQQRKALGNTRWLAWRDGLLSFDDFVKPTYSQEWGAGIAVPSLRETLGDDVKKEYQALAKWHKENGWDKEP